MLQPGRVIPRSELLDALEISPATFKRDIEYIRSRLNAPIEWSAEHRGYRLASNSNSLDAKQSLPGLWLDAQELAALLLIEQILRQIEPQVLGDALYPIRKRTEQLLSSSDGGSGAASEALRRVRVLPM
ncbi:MAG: transcriptional regulator, partial [Burkholderiales bacterium]